MRKKALYFDLQHGLSGDMILAALLGCFEDPQAVIQKLEAIDLGDGFRLALQHVQRSSIDTLHVDVLNEQGDVAEQATHGQNHGHGHGHRHLSSILALIDNSILRSNTKEMARSVFQHLGEAEAAAHNIDIQKVHFHEVGALDSMVDIVGTCFLFEKLQLNSLLFNEFYFGCGTIKASHGTLPVPVPAVVRLTEGYRFKNTTIQGELITPTAAALLTVLGQQIEQAQGQLIKSLFVSGSKHYADTPGFTRASLLQLESAPETTTQYVIEVNLDDISGERMAYAMDRALAAGARDTWAEHIVMKKGRPAIKLCILTDADHRNSLEQQILSDTHAWGLRTTTVAKRELPRSTEVITTPYGQIRRKSGELPDGSTHNKWEWDDIVALAQEKQISINTLLHRLTEELGH
ncbi:LarC family nickel insertion protein [Planctomycetota bacterium]